MPANPLVVKGVFYGLTADKDLFALNPATGGELWRSSYEKPPLGKGSGRGLVYWEGRSADGQQIQRILLGIGATKDAPIAKMMFVGKLNCESLRVNRAHGRRQPQTGND